MKRKLTAFILLVSILIAAFSSCTVDPTYNINSLKIVNGGRVTLELGDSLQFYTDLPPDISAEVKWSSSGSAVEVDNGAVTAVSVGSAAITAEYEGICDVAIVTVIDTWGSSVDNSAFYDDYVPADSYEEAVERSEMGLLSGTLAIPDQAPALSEHRPMKNGLFIRNDEPYYEDENTYVLVDYRGNAVLKIFRGGAYITLEEVAAYVYAFGDVPANYVSSKNTEPENSIWGEFLRLNHSKFTGSTKKYPYEPELPRISGCGGDLYYYEIDIGTTGTDCDPRYIAKIYNDGHTITRGAARIVYTRYDKNNNEIIEPNEKYLFYTYNHYNDFQEYLNYYGGWGEMFGNVTGGGTISSKTDYNPTDYVPIIMASLKSETAVCTVIFYCLPDKRRFSLAA